ncbi:hypothetical protein FB446DRAFT_139714 [Lentinula raphanica]|nr:hypothetical protein FB446DRAFT_139714 [Lentinula raphanica]
MYCESWRPQSTLIYRHGQKLERHRPLSPDVVQSMRCVGKVGCVYSITFYPLSPSLLSLLFSLKSEEMSYVSICPTDLHLFVVPICGFLCFATRSRGQVILAKPFRDGFLAFISSLSN